MATYGTAPSRRGFEGLYLLAQPCQHRHRHGVAYGLIALIITGWSFIGFYIGPPYREALKHLVFFGRQVTWMGMPVEGVEHHQREAVVVVGVGSGR